MKRYLFAVLWAIAVVTAWCAHDAGAQVKAKAAPPRAGQPKPPSSQPSTPAGSSRTDAGVARKNTQAAANSAEDVAAKRAILDSARWRRMMFEFKEWLSVQKIYNQQQ